ncbi:hypothetical protein R3P38DRAFT_2498548 [Favolaschia claudopus]|uniref:Uncharacterized protein n=1 Tax=Favolaschia claudopus TaxID=2862362 RepID=A0AAW0DSZ3_9AGAR
MCTLWQRLGRAARAFHLTAKGLFLVEPKRFDANIAKAEARAAKRAAAVKKRKQCSDPTDQPPAKRAAAASPDAPNVPIPVPISAPVTTAVDDPSLDVSDELDDTDDIPNDPLQPHSLASADKTSRAEYRAERRAAYAAVVTHEPGWKKQLKKRGADRLEPALDDFINAPTRQPGNPCYREPIMIFFGNDKTVSTHMQCRSDLREGCPRCVVTDSEICCELCSPDEFSEFARVDILKAKAQAPRSRIPKYVADPSDMALRTALHSFRKSRAGEVLGPLHYRKHGAGSIMSSEVLDRIADCAHFYKIQSTADLARETDWHRIAEDGTKVLAVIMQHRPPPGPAPSVPAPLHSSNTNLPLVSTPKNRKCGKCGQSGHIASNQKCPKYSARGSGRRVSTIENTPCTPTNPNTSRSTPPLSPSSFAVTPHLQSCLPFRQITNAIPYNQSPISSYSNNSPASPFRFTYNSQINSTVSSSSTSPYMYPPPSRYNTE